LKYLAVVVVQDALELAESFPHVPLYAELLEHSLFQRASAIYKEKKTAWVVRYSVYILLDLG
jgi:hypothetical protein